PSPCGIPASRRPSGWRSAPPAAWWISRLPGTPWEASGVPASRPAVRVRLVLSVAWSSPSSDPPRLAQGARPHVVGNRVVGELAFGGIPGQLLAPLERDERRVAGHVRIGRCR